MACQSEVVLLLILCNRKGETFALIGYGILFGSVNLPEKLETPPFDFFLFFSKITLCKNCIFVEKRLFLFIYFIPLFYANTSTSNGANGHVSMRAPGADTHQ